jgi:uncharacterized protein YjcR
MTKNTQQKYTSKGSLWRPLSVIALISWMALFCIYSSAAETVRSDAEWDAQRAKYDLVDREKLLLKADDELSKTIFESQQRINQLTAALQAELSERDRVRHALIVVRIKLLH